MSRIFKDYIASNRHKGIGFHVKLLAVTLN